MADIERHLNVGTIRFDRFETLRFLGISVGTPPYSISINSLLPPRWEIVESKRNQKINTDPERKRINLPPGYTDSRGHLFSLLHEIGHSHRDETASEDELETEIYLRNKFAYTGWKSLTKEEKRFFEDVIVTGEKIAWDYALATIVGLRHDGIDLEPAMAIVDLVSWAQQKLKSYSANIFPLSCL